MKFKKLIALILLSFMTFGNVLQASAISEQTLRIKDIIKEVGFFKCFENQKNYYNYL